MNATFLPGWELLRHGGLLLDPKRLGEVAASPPEPLSFFAERELRRRVPALGSSRAYGIATSDEIAAFVRFVLGTVCGFDESLGSWKRGPEVPASFGRAAPGGETVKPRHLWQTMSGGRLPVFIERERHLGLGRGRRATSNVLGWLRAGDEQLAVITNGRQWRLVFAGLDYESWCEWDIDLWLEEGSISDQVTALRALLAPRLWTPPEQDAPMPLLTAIRDSRKGQAELSAVLGERVRTAVETVICAHGDVLAERLSGVDRAEIYRAAVRMVMRQVVVLFAEARELLPTGNALYHGSYGLGGLFEELEKSAARGRHRLSRSFSAWPRLLALFRLIHVGSHHPSLPVPAYGGELFAPGDPYSASGLSRALAVFENGCFERELFSDRDVHAMLEEITRTRVKVRQGRASTWVAAPVDFSDLSSEYIGILYEDLLDFELKEAPATDLASLTWHTVKRGDTIATLAKRFAVKRADLAEANQLSLKTRLRPGQELLIPRAPTTVLAANARPSTETGTTALASSTSSGRASYRVRRGDTLYSIARQHGVSIDDLKEWNGLRTSRLGVGDTLTIRRSRTTSASAQ